MIYTFNLAKSGSDTPLLGEITVCFPEEDYDQVLAYLEGKCGEQYFEVPQWGTQDSDIYLFEDGLLTIKYSSDPLTDPAKIAEENRDRYVALSGMLYSSQHDMTLLTMSSYEMLWMYSTAETDFVKVDNTQ